MSLQWNNISKIGKIHFGQIVFPFKILCTIFSPYKNLLKWENQVIFLQKLGQSKLVIRLNVVTKQR